MKTIKEFVTFLNEKVKSDTPNELKTFEEFDSHWTNREKLVNTNNKTGMFDNDDLISMLDVEVYELPEFENHIITAEESDKLNDYFREIDTDGHVDFDYVGKTIKAAATELDDDYIDEWAQNIILCLFPEKYTPFAIRK